MPKRLDLSLACFVYIICLLIQTGGFGSIDTLRRARITHALWTGGSIGDATDYPGMTVEGRNGSVQLPYGIGQSLVMMPADIVATGITRVLHVRPPLEEKLRFAIVAYTTFPLIDALAILAAFHLLCALRLGFESALLGAAGMFLLTSFLNYSQVHQENNLMLLCTLILYWSVTRWVLGDDSKKWVIAGALSAGFNLLIRLPTILDFAGVLPFIALANRSAHPSAGQPTLSRRLVSALKVGVPIFLGFVLIDRLYEFYRFGSLSSNYIMLWGEAERRRHPGLPTSFPFSTNFVAGFIGPFFSPTKSIFLFDPAVLFAFAGLVGFPFALRRSNLRPARALLAGALIQLFAVVLFYARYVYWGSAVAWGDRFVTTPVLLLCLVGLGMLAEVWKELARWVRLVAGALVLVSFFIQLNSIVFEPALEFEQAETYGYSAVVVAQRARNVADFLTGGLQAQAAKYHWDAARLSFAPFALGAMLSGRLSTVLKVIWLVLLLLDAIIMLGFLRRVTMARISRAP